METEESQAHRVREEQWVPKVIRVESVTLVPRDKADT